MSMAPMEEDQVEESDEEILEDGQEQEIDLEAGLDDDSINNDGQTEPAPSNEDLASDL